MSIVLMGVYNICTGEPVIGVLNQPFCSKDEHGRWNGRVVWGVASEGFKLACVPRPERYHRGITSDNPVFLDLKNVIFIRSFSCKDMSLQQC